MPPSPATLLASRLPALIKAWRTRGAKSGELRHPGLLSASEVAAVASSLLALQRGLTGERSLAGSVYMDDPGFLGAYLLYYWPVSYLQVSLALKALGRTLFGKVLDLGAGPGPASAALADYGHTGHGPGEQGAIDFVLADSSAKALSIARDIIGQGERPDGSGKSPITIKELLVDLEADDCLREAGAFGPYDIIVMSHSLNELWKGEGDALKRRLDLLGRAASMLGPQGILLLLEPSLLGTSRSLLALRDALAERGFSILGPCLRQGLCPAMAAGPNHTCHSEAPWDPPEPMASLAKAAGLDRSSVKMTWLGIGKADVREVGAISSPAVPKGDRALRTEGEYALVVSEAMLNKAGRIRFLLCGESGRFAFSAKKGDPAAEAAGFFSLRRGDAIRIRGAELRGGEGGAALGFLPSTGLELASPAPAIAAEGARG